MKYNYQILHNSYTSAVQCALKFAAENNFSVDNDQCFQDIGINTKRPRDGETTRIRIDLYKNGVKSRKCLHAQVYNRGTAANTFELNLYIN